MITEYKEFIEVICEKFRNEITQLDVVSWLENFDESDWRKALIVLNAFEYYSSQKILAEFEKGIATIIQEADQKNKIVVVAVGKLGKSGAAMLYYLKKTPSFNKEKIKIFDGTNLNVNESDSTIVFIDDFSGTGRTIIDFYLQLFGDNKTQKKVYALTIAYMESAKVALKNYNISIVGNSRNAAFAPRGSVFGYYPRMVAIREFCFKYGNTIYPEVKYKKDHNNIHPLGYSNSQALVGFEHSIPNNTLPIMWADCRIVGTTKKWVPLFPRRGNLIIERVEEFKDQQRYWASIFFKLNLSKNWINIEERYSRESVRLLSLIFLKRKGKSTLNICQLLGINISEYDSIILYGVEKNIFDSDGTLTNQAITIIDEIRKRVRFDKSDQINLQIDEDILYVPKIFRGSS